MFHSLELTATGAQKRLGLEERSARIHACIEEAREIREAIDKLDLVQDRALLNAMGFSELLNCTCESEHTACSLPNSRNVT